MMDGTGIELYVHLESDDCLGYMFIWYGAGTR